MSRFLSTGLAVGAAALVLSTSALGGDAEAGAIVFKKCQACHAVGDDAKHKVGPHLNDLIGRTAGTAEGFRYSPAMMKAGAEGLVWNEAALSTYLADPRAVVKGTRMAFAGLSKADDIANVAAYLATFSEGAGDAPAEAEGGDAAMPIEAEVADAVPAQPTTAEGGRVLGIGRTATEEEISAWDIDVRPDGLGLPEGRGTVAEGGVIFDENCAACHGDFGEGIDRWPVLAGGQGTLTDERPNKTVGSYWPYLSTVYDYVRRAMPFGNARSMSDDDVYALTAYILYLNDIVTEEDFELSQETFASVKMPNEANFIDDNRFEEAHYADKGEPCMTDCLPGKAEVKMHAAVLDVTPEDAGEDEAPAAGIE